MNDTKDATSSSKSDINLAISDEEAIEIGREKEQEVKRMEDGDMDNIGRY